MAVGRSVREELFAATSRGRLSEDLKIDRVRTPVKPSRDTILSDKRGSNNLLTQFRNDPGFISSSQLRRRGRGDEKFPNPGRHLPNL